MFRESYEHVACAAAQKANISASVFFALITKESNWDPKAMGSGSYGIAQISPVSHPGVDVWNPVESLFYAAQLLRKYLNIYGDRENPYEYALAAYNVGNSMVMNWASIPQWEMRAYVRPILMNASNETTSCGMNIATPTPVVDMIQPQETPHPLLMLSFMLAITLKNFQQGEHNE